MGKHGKRALARKALKRPALFGSRSDGLGNQRHLFVGAFGLALGMAICHDCELGSQAECALSNIGQTILLSFDLSGFAFQEPHATVRKRGQKRLVQVGIADDVAQCWYTEFVMTDQGAAQAASLRHMDRQDRCRTGRPCAQAFKQHAAAVIDCQHTWISVGFMAIHRCAIRVQYTNAIRMACIAREQQSQGAAHRACTENGNIYVLMIHGVHILLWRGNYNPAQRLSRLQILCHQLSFMNPRFISKVRLGLLAALLGVVGAHWWYLGRRFAWVVTLYSLMMAALAARAEIWWDNPAFFMLFIPILDGFIEAIVFSLMSDEKFDARYNPGHPDRHNSGWAPVLVASFTLLFGTVMLMFGIAMIVIHIWSALGWLDGLNLAG